MDDDQIEKFTDDMVKQIDAIDKDAIKLSWYMRGGVTYADIMQMTMDQTNVINEVIESNMDATKKSGLPFF